MNVLSQCGHSSKIPVRDDMIPAARQTVLSLGTV